MLPLRLNLNHYYMRRVLLILTVLCGLSIGAFSQSSSAGAKWNIGIDPGIPLGSAHKIFPTTIGASVKYELPVAATTYFTISAGYQYFIYKDHISDVFDKSGEGIVPLKVGLKHYFDKGFFGEAQAGAAIPTEDGAKTSFVYAPGIGYTFSSGFEAGIRYEGYSSDGNNTGMLALRLGYRF